MNIKLLEVHECIELIVFKTSLVSGHKLRPNCDIHLKTSINIDNECFQNLKVHLDLSATVMLMSASNQVFNSSVIKNGLTEVKRYVYLFLTLEVKLNVKIFK